MPSYYIDKYVQGSYSQSHSKYEPTAGIQCACNALLAAGWAKVQNIAYWSSFDLDHVLDLGDDLYKHLGLNRYLDVSDLPHYVRTADGYNFYVNKVHLHDGQAVIGRGERFILNAFRNGSCAVLFINSTVTAITLHSRAYYFFDSHSRDSRGLSVADGSSVLLKFANILQLENHIQVAHLEYQGRERQYFQLQFVEIEVTDVLIDRNIRFVPSQRDVRNNGVNQNKYTATIEHEKMGTPIQNQAVTYDQNVNNDIMEIDFRRYQLKTDRKYENQEEDSLKSQAQWKSLEGRSSIDVLKIDLKEISFNNERRRLNY